jgi:hypothetical protein
MGFSMSWAAVRGGTPQAVHDALALRGTGAREEIPESEITGAELPGGWYMVTSNRDGLRLTEDAALGRLSRVGEVVMCFVEEHIMCSCAACWRDGQRVWSVYHDAQRSMESLDVHGEPPAPFAAIRDRLRAQQAAAGGKKADVDYIFDIPVELAHSVAGYRHDEDIPGKPKDAFEVLVSTNTTPKRRSWWRRLVGVC